MNILWKCEKFYLNLVNGPLFACQEVACSYYKLQHKNVVSHLRPWNINYWICFLDLVNVGVLDYSVKVLIHSLLN